MAASAGHVILTTHGCRGRVQQLEAELARLQSSCRKLQAAESSWAEAEARAAAHAGAEQALRFQLHHLQNAVKVYACPTDNNNKIRCQPGLNACVASLRKPGMLVLGMLVMQCDLGQQSTRQHSVLSRHLRKPVNVCVTPKLLLLAGYADCTGAR